MTSPMAALGGAEPPPLRLTGSHFAVAMGFFGLGAAGILWAAPQLAAGSYLSTPVASTVHLFTLGWITTSIMGALYPILPVALGRAIAWQRGAYVSLGLLAPGILLFVVGVSGGRAALLGLGATALGTAVLVFVGNVAATLARARPLDMTWWALAWACGFLTLTLVLGGALATNLHNGFLGAERLTAMTTHLHVALVGWVLLVMVGVGQKLLPMFLLSHGANERPGKLAVGLLASGTLLLFALHHVSGTWARWLPALLIGAGLASFLFQASLFFRTGKRPTLDPGLRLAAGGLVLLGTTLPLAAVLLTRDAAGPRLATAYVAAAVLGISLFVAGHYYKIVPFLIWYHRFAPLAGKTDVPTVADLYARPRANVAAALMAGGAFLVTASIALGWTVGVQAGAVSLGLGGLIEAAQLLAAARQKPPPIRIATAVSGDAVWDALGAVIDPEIGKDIVTLGLVYGVDVADGDVRVDFTLTTPGCPLKSVMLQAVEANVYAVPGVNNVETNLVWEPRWHPGMIREGALK